MQNAVAAGSMASARPLKAAVPPAPVTNAMPGPARRRMCLPAAAGQGQGQGSGGVVSLGEALFDCLADQLGVPKEQVTSWTPYPGGAPANVACALSRLGVPSSFVGALGTDDLGQQMVQLLKDRGVDVSGLQLLDNRPTRDVLVTRSLEGDREFSGFGKTSTDQYADCFLNAEQLPVNKIRSSNVLVTGTLGLAYPNTGEAMRAAVAAAKGPGSSCYVVADINWRPVFWQDEKVARGVIQEYIQAADIIKVTDEEVEWLLGLPADSALSTPERVLELLPNARGVLVSAGEKGSAYAFEGVGGKASASGSVPVLNVKVVDTTGAGDAYLAGFLQRLVTWGPDALMSSADGLREALFFASACGAFTCTGAGAIAPQPTLEQAEQLKEEAMRAVEP